MAKVKELLSEILIVQKQILSALQSPASGNKLASAGRTKTTRSSEKRIGRKKK